MRITKTKNGRVVYYVEPSTYKSIENGLNSIFVGIPRKNRKKLNSLFRDAMIGAFKDGYDAAHAEIGL